MKKQVLIAFYIFAGFIVLFILCINRYSFLYNHSITVQNKSGESLYRIIILFPDGKLRLINIIDNNESGVVSHPSKIEGLPEIFFSTRNDGKSSWFHESSSYVSPNLKSSDLFTIKPTMLIQPIQDTGAPTVQGVVVQPVSSDLQPPDSVTASRDPAR